LKGMPLSFFGVDFLLTIICILHHFRGAKAQKAETVFDYNLYT